MFTICCIIKCIGKTYGIVKFTKAYKLFYTGRVLLSNIIMLKLNDVRRNYVYRVQSKTSVQRRHLGDMFIFQGTNVAVWLPLQLFTLLFCGLVYGLKKKYKCDKLKEKL